MLGPRALALVQVTKLSERRTLSSSPLPLASAFQSRRNSSPKLSVSPNPRSNLNLIPNLKLQLTSYPTPPLMAPFKISDGRGVPAFTRAPPVDVCTGVGPAPSAGQLPLRHWPSARGIVEQHQVTHSPFEGQRRHATSN